MESNSINQTKVYYSADKWKEYPDYYVYIDSEDTIGYKQSKKGRVTGHIVSECIGDTGYQGQLLMAKKIAGLYKEEFTPEQKEKVEYGLIHEQEAKDWYTKVTGNIVKSPYFAVPKFDYRIGAEHDGFIYDSQGNELDGILEVKCPKEMYKQLIDPPKESIEHNMMFNYSHISRNYYDQMQMEMKIFNKNWCDYLVYCIPQNKVHLERVYRNDKYWDIMYEKICIFINAKVNPLLKEVNSMYPLDPAKK